VGRGGLAAPNARLSSSNHAMPAGVGLEEAAERLDPRRGVLSSGSRTALQRDVVSWPGPSRPRVASTHVVAANHERLYTSTSRDP